MSIDNQIIEFLKGNDYLPMKQHEIANALGIYEKNKEIYLEELFMILKRGNYTKIKKK